ncbi:hypothetical protein [Clostridium sp.]
MKKANKVIKSDTEVGTRNHKGGSAKGSSNKGEIDFEGLKKLTEGVTTGK